MRWVLAMLLIPSAAVSAATFPKPEPAKQFAELKVYDAQGRPWRSAVEDWAGGKQRVQRDPESGGSG